MTQGKKEQKKKWSDYLILLGLIIILILISRATWSLYQKNQIALANLHSSTERINKLTERQVVLRNKIERLKTERGIEEEIRNNFSVAKVGEQVVNIVEEKPVATTTATSTNSSWWPWW